MCPEWPGLRGISSPSQLQCAGSCWQRPGHRDQGPHAASGTVPGGPLCPVLSLTVWKLTCSAQLPGLCRVGVHGPCGPRPPQPRNKRGWGHREFKPPPPPPAPSTRGHGQGLEVGFLAAHTSSPFPPVRFHQRPRALPGWEETAGLSWAHRCEQGPLQEIKKH